MRLLRRPASIDGVFPEGRKAPDEKRGIPPPFRPTLPFPFHKTPGPEKSSRRILRYGGLPAGFTLMEVMVAVTILAIALTAVFRLQSQSVFLATRVRFDTVAPLLAQKVMARLMTEKEDELSSDSGDFGREFPGYTYKADVTETDSPMLGETTQKLKRLSVTVLFEDGVYRYKAEGFRLASTS